MIKPTFEQSALSHHEPFRKALASWFRKNARDYPWRRTQDPYAILVSEVMLQQTRIQTVLGKGYYSRFLEMFPDVRTIAEAADEPLLKAWEGLGYYRRARMLRETARAVIRLHGGAFPTDTADLLQLPGIGPYTAGALRAFAFGLPAVLVDGNIARVLSRLMNSRLPIDETAGIKRIWSWAEQLADPVSPRIHHAALMELGQAICRPGVPDCHACPVSRFCKTRKPETLPVKARTTTITATDEHAVWLRDDTSRILLHQERGSRRTGLWKLPVRQPEDVGHLPVLLEHSYAITRYRVNLKIHDGSSAAHDEFPEQGDHWIESDQIPGLAMAAPFRKVLNRLIKDF